MPVTKKCEVCNQLFSVKPYRAERARFCSHACGGKWHQETRILHNPNLAGNKFRAGLRPSNAFLPGQTAGRKSLKWVEPLIFCCEFCKETFTKKPWQIKQYGPPRFCSRACFLKSGAFQGDKSPVYVGGAKTYRGRNWRAARLAAIKRDNGACCRCGQFIGDSIPVHHIRPYREFQSPEEANALDNLICYCQSCHMKEEPPLPRRVLNSA